MKNTNWKAILLRIVQKSAQENERFVDIEGPRRFDYYIAPSSLILQLLDTFFFGRASEPSDASFRRLRPTSRGTVLQGKDVEWRKGTEGVTGTQLKPSNTHTH